MKYKMLETKRLILRKAELSDAKTIFDNISSSLKVTEYLTWHAHEDVGATELFIKTADDNKLLIWYCEEKTTKELIGMVSLKKRSTLRRIYEIGFCFGETFWNKGFASEASIAVFVYAFKNGAKKLLAKCLSENEASLHLLEKLNMHFTRKEEILWKKDGSLKMLKIYEISKKQFKKSGVFKS